MNCPIVDFWLDNAYAIYSVRTSDTIHYYFGKCDLLNKSFNMVEDLGASYYDSESLAFTIIPYRLDGKSFILKVSNRYTLYYWTGSQFIQTSLSDTTFATWDSEGWFYRSYTSTSTRFTMYSINNGDAVMVGGNATNSSSSGVTYHYYLLKRATETSIEKLGPVDSTIFRQDTLGALSLSPDGLKVFAGTKYATTSSNGKAIASIFDFSNNKYYRTEVFDLTRSGSLYPNSPVWTSNESIFAAYNNNIQQSSRNAHCVCLSFTGTSLNILSDTWVRSSDTDAITTDTRLPNKTAITTFSIDNNCIAVTEDYVGIIPKASVSISDDSKIYCASVRPYSISAHTEYNDEYYLCLGTNWIRITLS